MRKAIAVLGLVLAAGGAPAADDPTTAAKKLQGTYSLVSGTRGGKPDPRAAEIKAFTIKDDTITVDSTRRDKADTARFSLDPSQKPAHIDIKPGGDNVVKGIYEAKETDKGLELTLAFPLDPKDARPADFNGGAEGVVVLNLLRKKGK